MDEVEIGRRRFRRVKAAILGGAVALAVLAPASQAGATRAPATGKLVKQTQTTHSTSVKAPVQPIAKMAGRKVG